MSVTSASDPLKVDWAQVAIRAATSRYPTSLPLFNKQQRADYCSRIVGSGGKTGPIKRWHRINHCRKGLVRYNRGAKIFNKLCTKENCIANPARSRNNWFKAAIEVPSYLPTDDVIVGV